MMNKDVRADVNQLAKMIADSQGFESQHGYDFEFSISEPAREFWNIALMSYNFWSLKFVRTPK